MVGDAVTQPVFSCADAIREVVQVQSPVSSHDGDEPDIITVGHHRPGRLQMAFPRLPGVAEIAWTPHAGRWAVMDIHYYRSPFPGRRSQPVRAPSQLSWR